MTIREIKVGQYVERVELSDYQIEQARKLISTRPRSQINAEFVAASLARKNAVGEQVRALTAYQDKRDFEAQTKVENLQAELAQGTKTQHEANAAGSYGLAIQQNVKNAELRTDIMEAENELANTRMTAAGERMNYLHGLVNGPDGATVGGLDYKTFCNAARVIESEWYQEMSKGDISILLREQARIAADAFGSARAWAMEAEEKLEQHRAAAQAQSNGGVAPQPAMPQSQAVSAMNKRWGIKPPQPAASRPPVPVQTSTTKKAFEEIRKYTGRDYSNVRPPVDNNPFQGQESLNNGPVSPQYKNLGSVVEK